MDNLISIFGKSLKGLEKSPVLFIMGTALGILSIPALAGFGQFDDNVKTIAYYYTEILLPVLILPLFTGGALGCAVEARSKGSAGMSTFISSAIKNYPKLFVAGLIAFIIFWITDLALTPFGGSVIDPVADSLISTLIVVLTFFVLMAIELYDIGIVADGLGVLASFRNSADFVRRNMASVVSFFIVILILKGVVQMEVPMSFGMVGSVMSNSTYYAALTNPNSSLNYTAVMGMMSTATLSLPVLLVAGIFQAVIQGLIFAFLALFKTEFYLTVKDGKNVTDLDYQFPGPGQNNQFPKIKI
jgi:hypothetical protein